MSTDEVLHGELVTAGPPSTNSGTELELHGLNPSTWVDNWLGQLAPNSSKAYRSDLETFGAFHGYDDIGRMANELLTKHERSHFDASVAVDAWKTAMIDGGLAPSTINRRLSSVRSMVKHAHTSGLIPWTLTVRGLKTTAYRDTSGPGVPVVRRMVQHLDQPESPKACRDRAIVRLLFDRGLRRAEVVALDVADVDIERCRVNVIGKGKTEPEALTVAGKTCDAIAAWLAHRGTEGGPLFLSLDRAHESQRLSGRSVARIVKAAGEAVGADNVRPHGIRHTAITEVLDKSNGNVREARKFSRHAKLDTLAVYDDNREDVGGELAELIAAGV